MYKNGDHRVADNIMATAVFCPRDKELPAITTTVIYQDPGNELLAEHVYKREYLPFSLMKSGAFCDHSSWASGMIVRSNLTATTSHIQ